MNVKLRIFDKDGNEVKPTKEEKEALKEALHNNPVLNKKCLINRKNACL